MFLSKLIIPVAVAVVAVVSTQLLSDLAYIGLNPRVTFDTPSGKTAGAAA